MEGIQNIAIAFIAMALITGCEDRTSVTQLPSEISQQGTKTQAPITIVTPPPAQLSTWMGPLTAAVSATGTIVISIKNTSSVEFLSEFLSDGEYKVSVIFDFFDTDGKLHLRQIRSLPTSLASGKEETYQLRVALPATTGKYTLEINMVQNGRFYFKDVGVKSIEVPLIIK